MDQYQALPVAPTSLNQKIIGLLQKYPIILQFLKFAGIGFLTSAVDFLVLNLVSKALGVSAGIRLGGINVISFTVALVHSYIWNSNWAFGIQDSLPPLKIFFRSVMVGVLGVIGIILAIVGGKAGAPSIYYLTVLAVLVIVEIAVWANFGLGRPFSKTVNAGGLVATFIVVSIIGALINSGIVSGVTGYTAITANVDLNKNIAKVIATSVSLFWNFIGSKIFVFKK